MTSYLPPSEQPLEPRHLGSLRTATASGLQLRIPVNTDRACNQSLIGSAHGPMLVIWQAFTRQLRAKWVRQRGDTWP